MYPLEKYTWLQKCIGAENILQLYHGEYRTYIKHNYDILKITTHGIDELRDTATITYKSQAKPNTKWEHLLFIVSFGLIIHDWKGPFQIEVPILDLKAAIEVKAKNRT